MSQITNSAYTNPGDLFVQHVGLSQELGDILRYAQWLRLQAGIAATSRVDLHVIYSHFGVPIPQRVPLPDQQGMLLNSGIGLVLINQNDPVMRQRFTEAHELMEFLFEAAANNKAWRQLGYFRAQPQRKEKWCDEGAAELLMPSASIKQRLQTAAASFATARQLAGEFQTSLTASLLQMIKASEGHHAIVRWCMKHKPSETRAIANARTQMTMFGDVASPPKELRVDWSTSNSKTLFIPNDKSITEDTAVFAAWRDGTFTKGLDSITLGKRVIRFHSENQPFEKDAERQVLSLFTLIV